MEDTSGGAPIRQRAGRAGILAAILWFTAAVTLLVYGSIVAALMQAGAGLTAWTPAWVEARAKGKRVLPDWGRVVLGTTLFLMSFGEYPAKQTVAPVTAQSAAAPANDPHAPLTPAERQTIKQADYYRVHPGEAVEMTKMKWRKEGFGNVMIADLTIHNRSPFDLKDIVITCTAHGKSGTEIGAPQQTLFEVVKAKETRTFKGVNMGLIDSQTATANCQIFDASLA